MTDWLDEDGKRRVALDLDRRRVILDKAELLMNPDDIADKRWLLMALAYAKEMEPPINCDDLLVPVGVHLMSNGVLDATGTPTPLAVEAVRAWRSVVHTVDSERVRERMRRRR